METHWPKQKRDFIKVLHVEDDPNCREVIADQLSDRGFAIYSFPDAMALPAGLAAFPDADIILLDWDLPDVPGIVLLEELRQTGLNQPVVFLTGYASTAHEMLALNKGAVDFIDKTRGVDVLAGRLRRLLSVSKPAAPPAPIVRGKLVLHTNVGRAHWSGVDVGLTIGEYRIVHLLALKAGFWVTYRSIYDRVHYEGFIGGSGEDGYRMNVRGTIRRIRNKFLQCDETFAQLENFVGLGYRWASS
jgi:two-component system response regulator ChvI